MKIPTYRHLRIRITFSIHQIDNASPNCITPSDIKRSRLCIHSNTVNPCYAHLVHELKKEYCLLNRIKFTNIHLLFIFYFLTKGTITCWKTCKEDNEGILYYLPNGSEAKKHLSIPSFLSSCFDTYIIPCDVFQLIVTYPKVY